MRRGRANVPAPVQHPKRDEVPYVLLTVGSHPDQIFRQTLLTRLDRTIQNLRPIHTAERVRSVLTQKRVRELAGLADQPMALEAAVRVVQLSFARGGGTQHDGEVVGCILSDHSGGVALDERLHWVTRQSLKRSLRQGKRVITFAVSRYCRRLRERHPLRGGVQATVSIDAAGYRLTLAGKLPWRDETQAPADELKLQSDDGHGSDLGLKVTWQQPTAPQQGQQAPRLHLQTTTPEAIIRLSALMAAQSLVCVGWPRYPGRGEVYLRLQDFEGESAAIPCLAAMPLGERWISGIEPLEVLLLEDDRVRMIRHLMGRYCIPAGWMHLWGGDLLEKLL